MKNKFLPVWEPNRTNHSLNESLADIPNKSNPNQLFFFNVLQVTDKSATFTAWLELLDYNAIQWITCIRKADYAPERNAVLLLFRGQVCRLLCLPLALAMQKTLDIALRRMSETLEDNKRPEPQLEVNPDHGFKEPSNWCAILRSASKRCRISGQLVCSTRPERRARLTNRPIRVYHISNVWDTTRMGEHFNWSHS